MLTPEKQRRTEIRMPDGTWQQVHWDQLEPNDVIRMFNPDGTPVITAGGKQEMIVLSLPNIEIDDLPKEE